MFYYTRSILILLFAISFFACNKEDNPTPQLPINNELYFPPNDATVWENTTPESLNWNSSEIDNLYDYLEFNNTRAFIILKDGKMVLEKYWGNNILDTAPFAQNSNWYWASAGKTLTAFLVGLAQEEGLVDINNKTSDYLSNNWTSLPIEKENLITVRHQLTMTTGLDYGLGNLDCTEPACLQYKVDAGNQWYYHNGPYTLLEQVVSNASGIPYNQFTDEKLKTKIGMGGSWIESGYNNVYWSTARDAARFGLLILNKGKWDDTAIMTDSNYYEAMVTSSQDINPSYGYLWWLNGKNAIIYPSLANSFNTSLSPKAPADLFAAMGKNGQFIDIVPSENLVVIRMGEAPDDSLVPTVFHDEMWEKITSATGL